MAQHPVHVSSPSSGLAPKMFLDSKLGEEFGEAFSNDSAHETGKNILQHNSLIFADVF